MQNIERPCYAQLTIVPREVYAVHKRGYLHLTHD